MQVDSIHLTSSCLAADIQAMQVDSIHLASSCLAVAVQVMQVDSIHLASSCLAVTIQAVKHHLLKGSYNASCQRSMSHRANSEVKRCHTQQEATAKHTIALTIPSCCMEPGLTHVESTKNFL